jgi:hypothetical protein
MKCEIVNGKLIGCCEEIEDIMSGNEPVILLKGGWRLMVDIKHCIYCGEKVVEELKDV